MRAARLHAFGPAGNLTYEQTGTPVPGPGQVRIAVGAAGVHVIDTVFRQGDPKSPYPLPGLPTIPGREVAGTVDALGEGTDARWLGRRVAAHLGLRALEEAALAEEAAGRLVPAVQRFPLAEAAAAHRALETHATMGKVVLIP